MGAGEPTAETPLSRSGGCAGPPVRSSVAAHGKVLALLAVILERAGVVDASEFGATLSAFSDLDDDDDQRAILLEWADAISEAGRLET